jgi:hypothetical protein
MRRIFVLCISIVVFVHLQCLDRPLKVLHLSFHSGCTNDFDDVAKELNIDLTNWIPSDQVHFQGEYLANALYNISRDRGRLIWKRHKEYFEQFDVIMTSDTARLSRIFLENGWHKPLIIWICNRFDYFDPGAQRFGLPDQEYIDTMHAALTKKKVKIISYTSYEHHYARGKGVMFPEFTIKPLGHIPHTNPQDNRSAVSQTVKKDNMLFLYPRVAPRQASYIINACTTIGLPVYTGSYKGPEDLVGFRGVLYFPYAWSNLALFENIQQGIIHFVPSESFIRAHRARVRYLTVNQFELCEWYMPENRDLFVYFDSWQDLKHKVVTLNYEKKREHIFAHARQHRADMIGDMGELLD